MGFSATAWTRGFPWADGKTSHRESSTSPCRLDWMDYITRMTQANRNTTTSDRLTTVLAYGALLLLGYLVFLIAAPFLVPLAWSAVLAIFFYPVYLKLEKRFSG